MRVKIKSHSAFIGEEGTVTLTYYDRQQTGDSPDEFTIYLDNGRCITKLSSQVEIIEETPMEAIENND